MEVTFQACSLKNKGNKRPQKNVYRIFFSKYHPYLPAGDTTMTPLATIPSASMENFVKGKKCYHIIDKARQIVGK